jgi:predicted TIM-barrel fold metal-dependent hydrolase
MTDVSQRDNSLESIRGIRVIDVDTHLTEPADLWTSRAPKAYRDRVPRVEFVKGSAAAQMKGSHVVSEHWMAKAWRQSEEAKPMWVVDTDVILGFAGGASVINAENVKVKGSQFINWPLTEVSPAASYVAPRLSIMDEVGIWGQIVYPNAVGFGGQEFASIADPKLRSLCATIWNDAMAEMQEESSGRINGMGLVPWWDRDLAVSEIQRIHDLGLHGVNTNADPQNQGLPDLGDRYWDPMWEACAGLGLPVNFHIGASVSQSTYSGNGPWPSHDNDTKLGLASALLYIGNARVLANFIYSGLLDRHPALKVVSVESGIGWIPFILEALDYQAGENNIDHLELKPSEYFKRQIYACFWFEGAASDFLNTVRLLGVENCMFETDFPHPTCLYPRPLDGIAELLEGTDYESRRKLLGGNAARVYNLSLPEADV